MSAPEPWTHLMPDCIRALPYRGDDTSNGFWRDCGGGPEYIRKAVATAQTKAAVRDALEGAASLAALERRNREGGDNAFERGACASSYNIENSIRAVIARLDAEEPKP